MSKLNYNPIPFDDTYVLYDPNDPISFISVYFSLLPIGILIFYLSWFIITREIEPVIIASGQVVNDLINNIVKKLVKEERPFIIEGFQQGGIRSGYGMPSAHSQFMGFFATYLMLRVWLQWKGLTNERKIISTVLLYGVAGCVVFSRVYLYYHSLKQVLVGICLGSFIGACYFIIVGIVRSIGLVDYILSWKIVKFFWIKDSVYHEPLSLKDEYNEWISRREKSKNIELKKN